MMAVVLEPPLTRSGAWSPIGWGTPLLTGPRYVRTQGMSRWHRPRDGVRRDGKVRYGLWCGQNVYEIAGFIEADQTPPGEPTCGTCEGRAIGAGQDSWPDESKTLIFSPQRLTPPTRCPGSRTTWCEELSWNVGRCLVCGVVAPMRSSGGAYNPTWGLTNHKPGDRLIPGCPFHAWRELEMRDGRVACGCVAPGTKRNDPDQSGPSAEEAGRSRTGANDV